MTIDIELPDNVKEKIQDLAERTKISYKVLETEYLDRFLKSAEKFKADPQIQGDLPHQHSYILMSLWKDYIARPPVHDHIVIPVGFTGVRKAQSSGNPTATLFAIIKNEEGIQRINVQGPTAQKIISTVNLFDQYETKLGKFKNGGFAADDRSKFENPTRLKVNPSDLLDKMGIPRLTISEAGKHCSALRSDGYIEVTDWRCIRGVISRKWSREGKERVMDPKTKKVTSDAEDPLATYSITDQSIWTEDPIVLPDGTVQAPGFTCWIAPENQNYGVDDECDFYGSISFNKQNNVYQMNCYLVLPVIVKQEENEPA